MSDTGREVIGIIGVGEIAAAIVDGLCAGPGEPPPILLSPRGAATAASLAAAHPGVVVVADNADVAQRASILLLCLRADDLADALAEVRVAPPTLVVSAVAGVGHTELHRLLGPEVTVVRAIPMPAVRHRAGLTVIHPPQQTTRKLFDRLGQTVEVADADGFAALSVASATVSTLLGTLATIADWTAEHGVETDAADAYLRSVVAGIQTGLAASAGSLREVAGNHETPGGLNEQLRTTWLDETNSAALRAALDAVLDRVTRVE